MGRYQRLIIQAQVKYIRKLKFQKNLSLLQSITGFYGSFLIHFPQLMFPLILSSLRVSADGLWRK